ncbi:MAG: hypothetical protein HY903_10855 [Deltaproteobacteria bacterium]|nr:hypothetical protein [Deltaproteobacteria bacterium]
MVMSAKWLIFLVLPACLLPPAVDEVATPVNQPPRIDPVTLSPSPAMGPIFMSIDCNAYRFYATITDPDPDDTIYWRVFLDYHRDRRRLFTEVKSLAPDPGQTNEGRSLLFTVYPNDERFKDGDLTYTEPHTVELLVADRGFFDGPEPQARTVDPDGLIASFVWPVQLGTTADPGCVVGTP